MMYDILKGHKVNFVFLVMDWMMEKAAILHSPSYKDIWQQKKVGLPYSLILTDIFQRFAVDFSNLKGIPITRNQTIHECMLRSMRLYRTLNRGWVFYPYLRDGDTLSDPRDPFPTHEEQVFR